LPAGQSESVAVGDCGRDEIKRQSRYYSDAAEDHADARDYIEHEGKKREHPPLLLRRFDTRADGVEDPQPTVND
jgi:hypothetical protein